MVEQSDGEMIESEESILAREPWRSTALEIRADFVTWAENQHHERQAHGIEEYGPVTFKGEPLDQGIEENLDQLFYLYWAKRKLAFVEGQRNTYRHLLESVMEFGLTETVAGDIYKVLGVPKDQEI